MLTTVASDNTSLNRRHSTQLIFYRESPSRIRYGEDFLGAVRERGKVPQLEKMIHIHLRIRFANASTNEQYSKQYRDKHRAEKECLRDEDRLRQKRNQFRVCKSLERHHFRNPLDLGRLILCHL